MRSEANFSSITCSTSGSGISSPLFCFNSNSAICALACFSFVSASSFADSPSAPPCTPISRPRHPTTALISYQPLFSFGQPCRSHVPTVFVDTCIISASVAVLTNILPSSVSSMRLLRFGGIFPASVCCNFAKAIAAFGSGGRSFVVTLATGFPNLSLVTFVSVVLYPKALFLSACFTSVRFFSLSRVFACVSFFIGSHPKFRGHFSKFP